MTKKKKNLVKLTTIAEHYLTEHAAVRTCLARGLINYTALAREIAAAAKVTNIDALQIACRRYAQRKNVSKEQNEDRVIRLLRNAKLRVRNKIAVVTIKKPEELDAVYSLQAQARRARADFNLIEADEAITIVVPQDWANEITQRFSRQVKNTSSGLVQIALIFDRQIEVTPGVVAYVYGLLADAEINVLEESSCWTDIMMVIKESDLTRAMKVLTLD